MTPLTNEAQQAIENMSQRYGVSADAVRALLDAVNAGGGTMAQFSHPELGGSGQWMRGGMTMVGDMFNSGLQGTVANLCGELSSLLASMQVYAPVPLPPQQSQQYYGGSFQQQGGGFQQQSSGGFQQQGGGFQPQGGWWPPELGAPSSSGGQNDMRYAVFPGQQRLAIERFGHVTIYDTQNHQIGGVSQQNGGVAFSSQLGMFTPEQLPVVSSSDPSRLRPQPPAPQQSAATHVALQQSASAPGPGASASELMETLEKLGQLHQQGILSDDEFAKKKADILSRL